MDDLDLIRWMNDDPALTAEEAQDLVVLHAPPPEKMEPRAIRDPRPAPRQMPSMLA